jgi:hypothetical protein
VLQAGLEDANQPMLEVWFKNLNQLAVEGGLTMSSMLLAQGNIFQIPFLVIFCEKSLCWCH